MALYALGDFHLSFGVDKPMDIFGREWKNHEKKIEKYCRKLVKPEDTLVITGDHSWGRNLTECEKDLARAAGYEKFIMFLHYPPTTIGEQESPFTLMAEECGASKVIYSHCHGRARFDDSFKGYVNGIEYKLVSGDYLGFKPELILK